MYTRFFHRRRQDGVPNITNHQFAQLPFFIYRTGNYDLFINPTNCKYIANGRAPLLVFSVVETHDDSILIANAVKYLVTIGYSWLSLGHYREANPKVRRRMLICLCL